MSVRPEPEERIVCPSCRNDKQNGPLEQYREWALYECAACQVQHFWPATNPGPDWYEDSEMYQSRHLAAVDWPAWYHDAALQRLRRRTGTLLDVGCGNGTFVAAARDVGFDATGIDFSARAIDVGRQRFGLENLFCGSLDDYLRQFPAARFDVVTAFEVLEHMDDCRTFVDNLKQLIAPGGTLIVSVPNRDRVPWLLNEGDYPPHHFTRWSKPVLWAFLDRGGFRVDEITVAPAHLALKTLMLHRLHFNVVVRMLRNAKSDGDPRSRAVSLVRARRLALLKDRLTGAIARAAAPIAAPFVRGPMMVAVARKPAAPMPSQD